MQSPKPLLEIGAARAIVCKHVGEGMDVIACWQPPKPLHRLTKDGDNGDNNTFYFAVIEKRPMRIGGTRHVAVNRRSGTVTELGMLGE